jgi:glycosyltransferase involved in cell wall biosynthesis
MPLSICMLTYEYPVSIDEAVVSGEVKNPFSLAQGLIANGHRLTVVNVPFLTKVPDVRGLRDDRLTPTYDVPEGRSTAVIRYALRTRNVERFLRNQTLPRFDVIHAQAPALAGSVVLARRRNQLLSGVRLVTTGHGTNLPEADADAKVSLRQRARIANARLVLPIDRWAFKASDAVVSVSSFQREELERLYGVPKKKIAVIYNGVDLERYTPDVLPSARPELNIGEGPLILFVGRLVPKKGLQHLFAALPAIIERVPNVRCAVVGGSPAFDSYSKQLHEFARSHGVDGRIQWLSSVPETELPSIYASATVCAFPSEGYESLPTVALEAMASGKPVVATRSWGTPEALGDDHPGLIEESDPAALASSLIRMLTEARTRDRAVAEQNQRLGSFALKKTVADHEALYHHDV